ncbi:MAG TPA: VWA domain-containing protein [Terriglobia bacterium]|nr:VWA domain-containing protein [Terriglobia bacterium]
MLSVFCFSISAFCFLIAAIVFRPSAGLAQTGQAATPPAAASGFGRQGSGFVIHVQTNLVLVDVRATDKRGDAVTDLKAGDFQVFEDGVEQKINSFSLENIAQLASAGAGHAAPATIDFGKLPPTATVNQVNQLVQDHRLIVLFFDLSSMPVDDLLRAADAAEHFVQKQLTPADLVAVATYSSDLRVAQNFTNDRGALDRAIHAIRVGEASSLAGQGATGAAGGTSASGEETVAQDTSEAFTPDETEFNIFNTDEKLAALESMADLLRGVPGRKSVIHFSSGVERTGIENQAQLRATTDAANRANVSFYTVDARGLVGLPPGGDASTASPSGTAIYTASAVSSQFSSLEGGRETLASLAADTGGRTFYDLNDFSPAFADVQRDNSTYYLLGYSPSNAKSDGRFRRIRVEVDRPGVKLQSRPGYYAPKNFRQFTAEDKEVQLEQAMNLDEPFVDLPLAVEASYFRRPHQRYDVVVAAKIPGDSISFLNKSTSHRTEFDFAWRAADAEGHVAAALRDTLPVRLSPDTYAQVLASNFLYVGGIVLPPGTYKLKAVVRENESGKIGTFEEPLALPAPGGAGLAVSSVVVSNQVRGGEAAPSARGRRNAPSGPNPLEAGGQNVLPSVTRVFRTDQNLYAFLEAYAPKIDMKSGQPAGPASAAAGAPSVALVFFRGGALVSEAGPFPAEPGKSPTSVARYLVKIPLAKFPPGRYWMQVNVLDPAADQVAFARVPLAIMRPPVSAPAASSSGK